MSEKYLIGKYKEWNLYRTTPGRYSLYYGDTCRKANMTNDTVYYYWINIIKKKGVIPESSELSWTLDAIKKKKGKRGAKVSDKDIFKEEAMFIRAPGNVDLRTLSGKKKTKLNEPQGWEPVKPKKGIRRDIWDS